MDARATTTDAETEAPATEAYYESRLVGPEVTKEVTVVDALVGTEIETEELSVTARKAHSRLFLLVESEGNEEWLRFSATGPDRRARLLSMVGASDFGLGALVGSERTFHFDYDEGTVRADGRDLTGEVFDDTPNVVVGVTHIIDYGQIVFNNDSVPPTHEDAYYDRSLDEFDRLARIEGAMYGSDPATVDVQLDVTVGDDVCAVATVGGEAVVWTFDAPSVGPYSEVEHLVDEVGAGDPEMLDGHPVTLCLTEELADDQTRFEADNAAVAIVPDGIDVKTKSESRDWTLWGLLGGMVGATALTAITGSADFGNLAVLLGMATAAYHAQK